ncbi:subtilisin-like protein [Crepidotus variabilis]|uniref:tripeptidyl-peptidase II n=1 Tax=Crepidotus variabilis TaxID=179855 RepID=A0A9P6EQE2_9AGAR|nr:subtilisin-like protein [Crepidotus variabilis]
MGVLNLKFTLFASFLTLAVAVPQSISPYLVKEEILPPRGWVKSGKPALGHTITLRIGLPQPNFHVLESHLYEISDPDHERYGNHLTKEEVEDLVRPHPDSLDAVNEWLYSAGFAAEEINRSPAHDWVLLTIPVSKAEDILDTTYHVWTHTASGDSLIRSTRYSLPRHLHDHVELVQPTTMFGRTKRERSHIFAPFKAEDEDEDEDEDAAIFSTQTDTSLASGSIDPSCNTTITVSCLLQLYNATGYEALNKSNNSIGITGYLEEYANLQDLQSFYSEQRPDALNSSFNFVSIKDGLNSQNLSEAGEEAGLDVQFAFGISFPVPGTFWSTAGRPPFQTEEGYDENSNEPYQDWLDSLLGSKEIPLVISTSYGDDEQTVPKSYALRVCAGFAQLGARGVSLLFSSGDAGVGDGESDPAKQTCFTNDGTNQTRFRPAFPASCPYVTTVGGTENVNPEVAVSSFFSGGGFSDYFVRPAYQEAAVSTYLSKLPRGLYQGLYDQEGRAFPDVAAQGDRFRIWNKGRAGKIGGTSASSPTFAGFVALLNDARLKTNQPPLGFLNPFLYSKGRAGMNDILDGSNPGCGTPGFNVTTGWDPVTGLGTPDFGKLKEIVI